MKTINLLLTTFAILLFATRTTAQTIPSYIPTNGLVAWYPFNGNANDESGNGNHGTVNGATLTTDRNGNPNKSYSFNGSNNRIDLPLNLNGALLNLRKFSLQCYVKDLSTNGGGIFSNWKAYPLTDPFGVIVGSSGTNFGATNNAGTGVNTSGSINLSNWNHLVVVFDGDQNGALNRMKLYINGVIQQADSGVLAYSNTCISDNLGNTATHTVIGAWISQFGWFGYFLGSIDDIAIYNRALTQTEITQLYTNCNTTTSTTNLTIPSTSLPYTWNGLTFYTSGTQTIHLTNAGGCDSAATLNLTVINTIPNYVPTNGLVGWYPFNGNTNDESGTGNNGTNYGATLTNDRNNITGKAYSFNGNGEISIANNSTLNFQTNNTITVSYWFKTNINQLFRTPIIQKQTGGGSTQIGLNIGLDNGGDIGVRAGISLMSKNGYSSQWGSASSDTFYNFTGNNWFHIVVIYANGIGYCFVNGTLNNTLPSQTGIIGNNSNPLLFGSTISPSMFSKKYIGLLDDIAIFNRALTQTEITQLYTNCKTTTSTTNLTIPSTSLPYTWNGLSFNSTGSQTKHLTNAGGCDSAATLNLTVINTALPSYLPANGLVAWYPFNGNANDDSGNGNNGAVNGATLTNDRNGSLNSAYNFTVTSSNHISLNNTIGNFGTSNFTVSGWQMRSSGSNGYCMFGKRNAIGSGNYFEVNSNPGFEIRQGTNSSDYLNDGGLNSFNSNQWFHTTIVRNGTQILLYINGTLVHIYTSPITQNISNSALTEIGARYAGSSLTQLYDGKLDDIGIWSRALNQTEITALYSSSQNTINLNLSAFLEGSYTGSSNMTATPNKVNAAISNSIADTINVELHANTSPYATIYSSKGVLNTNGTATIAFPNSAIGNSYYIVIKHRNSIETWSAAPVAINNNTIYNFSTSASQAFGANLSNMGDGVFAIFSGDINQDGSVDFNDYPDLDIASNLGVLGYDVNDLNGDASVDFNDYPILDINSNNGVLSVKP